MAKFPHLPLAEKINGLHKPKRIRIDKVVSQTTKENLANRNEHANSLTKSIDSLSKQWTSNLEEREYFNLPNLPDSNILPVFLKIDTQDFNVETLQGFGVEIISEEEDGYIIGASSIEFTSLREKIAKFLAQEGKYKDKAAKLWDINEGFQWRLDQILSDDLKNKWDLINDDEILVVDVGIACDKRLPQQPEQKEEETTANFQKRIERWQRKVLQLSQEKDDLELKRQDEFEALVNNYGRLLSGYADNGDSFSCRIEIQGRGLKDILLNYQYLFEVIEFDPLIITDIATGEIDHIDPDLIAPGPNFPKVCVIDSGIQEEHRLLSSAMDSATSISFVNSDTSYADVMGNGGHGTRVAGAVLYTNIIPEAGQFQLPCFIQNAKVLTNIGGQVGMSSDLFPPKLMEDIVDHFNNTRIFNMSINSSVACKITHMSQWGATIDKLIHAKDILFILSAGNIQKETGSNIQPGIKEHLQSGRNYPAFLLENSSRLANPAQSCFAITVGSICIDKFEDESKESFGSKDDPSSFSRTGLGLWGMIKPDVVEYGGDIAKEKNSNPNLSNEASISPRLIKSTYGGGLGIGNDSVGTSYAAPKVAHIAAVLQRLYPNETSNLYRTLIIQSARLPESVFQNPRIEHIRHYGYGIPDLSRATNNSEKRLTLIASERILPKQANIYSIKIPNEIRRPGEDYDILIEVTLAYTAEVRRTRKKTNSYLSAWLDWESCKLGESNEAFSNRILRNIEDEDGQQQQDQDQQEDPNTIRWVIRERSNWSRIPGIRRQDSTIQKSWVVIKSYDLPEAFSLAIIGHKGWEKDLKKDLPYSIAISFEALNSNINLYEMIRIENQIEIPIEIEQEIRS